MTLMLYHLPNPPHSETFYQSLPIAGRLGTLRKIAQGANCVCLAHAKSGCIWRGKTSCGHLGTISGERYAFTLLINNFTGEVSSVKAKIVRIWNKMVEL